MKEFKQFLTRKTRADGVNEKESTILAVAGKGGVGKSSIAAVMVKLLVKEYPNKKILASVLFAIWNSINLSNSS